MSTTPRPIYVAAIALSALLALSALAPTAIAAAQGGHDRPVPGDA